MKYPFCSMCDAGKETNKRGNGVLKHYRCEDCYRPYKTGLWYCDVTPELMEVMLGLGYKARKKQTKKVQKIEKKGRILFNVPNEGIR